MQDQEGNIQSHRTVFHGEIAKAAWQLWQTEGCQPGHDLEYWLQAEQQLLAARQPASGRSMNVSIHPDGGRVKGKALVAHAGTEPDRVGRGFPRQARK